MQTDYISSRHFRDSNSIDEVQVASPSPVVTVWPFGSFAMNCLMHVQKNSKRVIRVLQRT